MARRRKLTVPQRSISGGGRQPPKAPAFPASTPIHILTIACTATGAQLYLWYVVIDFAFFGMRRAKACAGLHGLRIRIAVRGSTPAPDLRMTHSPAHGAERHSWRPGLKHRTQIQPVRLWAFALDMRALTPDSGDATVGWGTVCVRAFETRWAERQSTTRMTRPYRRQSIIATGKICRASYARVDGVV